MATTTRSQSGNAKPSSRAQSKKGTTTSPIKKARAPARKPRGNAKTQSRAQSIISVHGSDSGTPSTPSTPGPRILTIVHPSDRTLITRLPRLPAVNSRLRLRHRRDLATHLPPLGDPTERRVTILEAQAAELQELNNRLSGEWREELEKALETEEGDWRRGMLKAKRAELELKRVELGLRWELMLREEMTYE